MCVLIPWAAWACSCLLVAVHFIYRGSSLTSNIACISTSPQKTCHSGSRELKPGGNINVLHLCFSETVKSTEKLLSRCAGLLEEWLRALQPWLVAARSSLSVHLVPQQDTPLLQDGCSRSGGAGSTYICACSHFWEESRGKLQLFCFPQSSRWAGVPLLRASFQLPSSFLHAVVQLPSCSRQLLCRAASLLRLGVCVLPQSQLPLSTAKGFRATLCFPHQTLPVAVCLFCFVLFCLNKVIIQSLPLEMIHLLCFLRAVWNVPGLTEAYLLAEHPVLLYRTISPWWCVVMTSCLHCYKTGLNF